MLQRLLFHRGSVIIGDEKRIGNTICVSKLQKGLSKNKRLGLSRDDLFHFLYFCGNNSILFAGVWLDGSRRFSFSHWKFLLGESRILFVEIVMLNVSICFELSCMVVSY